MTVRQRLRHWLGWNVGTIASEYRGDELWIGFACECGETHDWHKSVVDWRRSSRPARRDGG